MTDHERREFLCRSLALSRGDRLRRWLERTIRGGVVWEDIIELSSRQLLCPALYRAYADKHLLAVLPEDVRDYLQGMHVLNAERNQHLLGWTTEIVQALNRIGVEPVVLKGMAGLFLRTYPDRGVRVVRDLDLLVPAPAGDDCVGALRAIGYGDLESRQPLPSDHHHRQWLWRRGVPMVVEVHVHAVEAQWQGVLPTDDMWRGVQRIAVPGVRLQVPAAEHRVVHAVVHAIQHAELGHGSTWHAHVPFREMLELIWLRARLDAQTDWTAILERFDRRGKAGAVRTFLFFTERLLNAKAPAGCGPGLPGRAAYWAYLAAQHVSQSGLAEVVAKDLASQVRTALRDPALATRFALNALRRRAYRNVAERLHSVWDEAQAGDDL